MQLFGDNNTLVRYAHSCVIITKKLHSIPYDTVMHWNLVINPSIYFPGYMVVSVMCKFHSWLLVVAEVLQTSPVRSQRRGLYLGAEDYNIHCENIMTRLVESLMLGLYKCKCVKL